MNEVIEFNLSDVLIGTKTCSQVEFNQHISNFFGRFTILENKELHVISEGFTFSELQINRFKYPLILIFNNCKIDNLVISDCNSDIFLNSCNINYFDFSKTQKNKFEMNFGSLLYLNIVGNCNLTVKNVQSDFNMILNFGSGGDISNISLINSSLGVAILNPQAGSLNKVSFKSCTLYAIKELSKVKFESDISFLNCNFIFTNSEYEPVYRQLKASFLTLKNDNLFNLFSSLEHKSHHTKLNLTDDGLDYIFGWFYKLINDFGLSPYRPLYILTTTSILLFFIFYPFIDKPEDTFKLSLIFFLGPFKYLVQSLRHDNIHYILELILNFTSGLLWFFFIIGVRKRFKIEK